VDREEALDRLYAAPIDEFTATRNAVAADLKKAGEEDAATTVKALKKPNLAAWAVNQVVRRHGDEIDALFTVTDKLRHAQRRVLSGGKASDLRTATDERNRIVGRLTKLVEKVLTDAGHGTSASTLAAAGESFVAVASDDVGAELLRKGRLTRELAPGSVLDVGGLSLVPRDDEEEPDAAEQDDRSRLQEAKRERDAARATLKAAREELKKANTEATRLEIESDEATKRAKSAHEKADFARRAAEARKDEVTAAERAVEEAEKAVKAAGN
jgi:hypothetical protein